jgi:hypothetical protein
MPPAESEPAAGEKSGLGRLILRILESAMLVVLVWAAVSLGIVCIRGTAQERQNRELERIIDWVARARVSRPAGVDANEWHNITGAVHNALYNPLYYPKYAPTEKVRALADELDATQAAGFATVEGVLRFMRRLEEICPRAVGYGPFEEVRMEYPREAAAAAK